MAVPFSGIAAPFLRGRRTWGETRYLRDAGHRLATYRITPGPLVPALRYRPGPHGLPPPRRYPAPRQLELTAIPPGRAIPESGGAHRGARCLDWPGGRACEYSIGSGHPAHRRQPAGIRARTRGGPADLRRAGAVPAGRRHRSDPGRCLDRQHQQDARALRGWGRVPNPAAASGRRRRPGGRMARARGDRDGRLTFDAGRRPADRGHGSRQAPAASRRGGCGRAGAGGRGRDRAAALPRPKDQALPRGADVVPAVAA